VKVLGSFHRIDLSGEKMNCGGSFINVVLNMYSLYVSH
jgi:hypothetical protein